MHELAHLETDECGAPEFFSNGSKVLLVPGQDGRWTRRAGPDGSPPQRHPLSQAARGQHQQATELGTDYTADEVAATASGPGRSAAGAHGRARLANALATLKVPPRKVTWEAGWTSCAWRRQERHGMGEAVVFFDKKLAEDFDYRCKQSGQPCPRCGRRRPVDRGSGERGLARNGQQANRVAADLARCLEGLPGIASCSRRRPTPCSADAAGDHRPATRTGMALLYFHRLRGARLMCSGTTRAKTWTHGSGISRHHAGLRLSSSFFTAVTQTR